MKKKEVIFFLIVVFSLCIWIYLPGLGGGFVFDDDQNISGNPYLQIEHFTFEDLWQASLSNNSGILKRPIVMLSFAINYVLAGMSPWWMKFTNLLIHLINGVLVLLVIKQLFRRFSDKSDTDITLIPYFIMGIWLVHPINVTAVSYIVQRMTSLSATFVLLAVYSYLKLREERYRGWRGGLSVLSILFFWVLGLLSKENAILLSIYIFVIEWCIYNFQTGSRAEKIQLGALWILLAIPWVGALFYVIYHPSFVLNDYQYRDFTLPERVLTEFRIVSEYIRLIIVPDIRHMGLFHDDIVLSTSIISPFTTLLSILFLFGLFALAIGLRKRYALFSLGVLWFLGGHILESTVLALEPMFLHRNYLPSIGLLLIAGEVFIRLSRHYHKQMSVVAILILLGFSICTRFLDYQWSGDPRLLIIEVMNNPDSIRANFRAGQVYKFYAITSDKKEQREEYKSKAIKYFQSIKNIDKNNITGEMGMLVMYLQLQEAPPPSLIKRLCDELVSAKVELVMINIMKSVKNCMITGKCVLKDEDYQAILQALLKNPKMKGDFKRKLLLLHAEYLAKAKKDIDSAIKTVLGIILEYPTLDDLKLVSRYYEEGGYKDEMMRALDFLEKNDKYGQFSKFIKETRDRYHRELETK